MNFGSQYVNNLKMFKKIVCLLVLSSLFSCATKKYHGTLKWEENNRLQIDSENLNEFKISTDHENLAFTVDKGSTLTLKKCKKNECKNNSKNAITSTTTNKTIVNLENFKLKGTILHLSHPNYDTVHIEIKRRVRYDALAKDVGLSLITYGIPLIVDVFKSDFYKLKKSSKNHVVRFEYRQSYMLDEYKKISNSMNPNDFNDWLSKYPKSNAKQTAINRKDSVELIIALSKGQEAAIDEYILAHKGSVFLNEAEGVKKEMVLSRELFTSACQKNSVEAYEDFLSKYPKSLHNKEVQKLLLNAAEREAIATSSSEKMIFFIKNYFIPNIKLIEIIETNTFSAREKKIKNSLEDFIIKEALQNNQDNKYENYRLLWSKYSAICKDNNIPSVLKNFDKIKKYQVEICDYLFNKLKDANTIEKQSIWIQKTLDDFPELELNDNFPAKSNDILQTIIETQANGTGKILVFNSNILSQIPRNSKIDNGLIAKYNFGKYEYQGNTIDALATCNYQELNFAKGILNGINKAYKDKQLQYSIDANKDNEITDEISYYKDGKLVKTIFISKECASDGNCIVNKDFVYEFENGVNLTLNNLDKEISKIEKDAKVKPIEEIIEEYSQLKNNNFPSSLPQNLKIEKLLSQAQTQKIIKDKKKKEEDDKAAELARLKIEKEKNDRKNQEKTTSTIVKKNSNIPVASGRIQTMNEKLWEGGLITDEEYKANLLKENLNKENKKNSESENNSNKIKSIYCITMKGEKVKVILYESGECDYVLFNIFGEIQKSLSGKWTMRNLGVYGGWTITITFDHGSSAFKCQMNGFGDIQALIDDLGNYWENCK